MAANVHFYRAKAWECLSLAENMHNPKRRADMLRFARAWLSLSEPIGDLPIPRSPYELPTQPRYSFGTETVQALAKDLVCKRSPGLSGTETVQALIAGVSPPAKPRITRFLGN